MGFTRAIWSTWVNPLLLAQTSVLKSEVSEASHSVLLTMLPCSTACFWNPSPALGRFSILSALPSLQISNPLSHLKTVCIRHKIRHWHFGRFGDWNQFYHSELILVSLYLIPMENVSDQFFSPVYQQWDHWTVSVSHVTSWKTSAHTSVQSSAPWIGIFYCIVRVSQMYSVKYFCVCIWIYVFPWEVH